MICAAWTVISPPWAGSAGAVEGVAAATGAGAAAAVAVAAAETLPASDTRPLACTFTVPPCSGALTSMRPGASCTTLPAT